MPETRGNVGLAGSWGLGHQNSVKKVSSPWCLPPSPGTGTAVGGGVSGTGANTGAGTWVGISTFAGAGILLALVLVSVHMPPPSPRRHQRVSHSLLLLLLLTLPRLHLVGYLWCCLLYALDCAPFWLRTVNCALLTTL